MNCPVNQVAVRRNQIELLQFVPLEEGQRHFDSSISKTPNGSEKALQVFHRSVPNLKNQVSLTDSGKHGRTSAGNPLNQDPSVLLDDRNSQPGPGWTRGPSRPLQIIQDWQQSFGRNEHIAWYHSRLEISLKKKGPDPDKFSLIIN